MPSTLQEPEISLLKFLWAGIKKGALVGAIAGPVIIELIDNIAPKLLGFDIIGITYIKFCLASIGTFSTVWALCASAIYANHRFFPETITCHGDTTTLSPTGKFFNKILGCFSLIPGLGDVSSFGAPGLASSCPDAVANHHGEDLNLLANTQIALAATEATLRATQEQLAAARATQTRLYGTSNPTAEDPEDPENPEAALGDRAGATSNPPSITCSKFSSQ